MTRKIVRVGSGVLLALVAPLACTSFDASPAPDMVDGGTSDPDGGGGGPAVTGSRDIGIKVEVGDPTSPSFVIQGDHVNIPVKLTRMTSSMGAVNITISGLLPDNVKVDPLLIPANATEGSLVLSADTAAVQAKFRVSVLASEFNGVSALGELKGFVRGKPGSLDTTFGTNGIVRNIFGTTKAAIPLDVLVLPDDRVAVAGTDSFGASGAIGTSWATRFSADGVFDTTYGTGGYGALRMSSGLGQAGVDGSGRIFFVGNGSANSTLIGRLDATGQADAVYGTVAGYVPYGVGVTQIGGTGPVEGAQLYMGVRADGYAVVAFASARQTGSRQALRAFDTNGLPASGFGTGGAWESTTLGGASIVGFRSSGNFWTAWDDGGSTRVDEHAAATGDLVPAFGGNPQDGVRGSWAARGAAALPDTSIVFAVGQASSVLVGKFVKDGTHLDTAYGLQGVFTIDGGATPSVATDTASRTLVALRKAGAGIRIARVLPAGGYDTAFGDSGTLTHNFGTNQILVSIAQQKDGRIVVVGQEDIGGATDATLSRYWN